MPRIHIFLDSRATSQRLHLREAAQLDARLVPDLCSGSGLNQVIRDARVDWALCCHASVSLPYDIGASASDLVTDLNARWGDHGWIMAGNAGIEAISLRSVRYRYDNRLSVLPGRGLAAIPAVGLDGHLALLNCAALRRHNLLAPEEKTFRSMAHLALLVQGWEQGLASVLDARLYAHHDFFPVRQRARLRAARACFGQYSGQETTMDRFGVVSLGDKADAAGFHGHVLNAVSRVRQRKGGQQVVHVLTRTRLDRPWFIHRLLQSMRGLREQVPEGISLRLVLCVNNVPDEVRRVEEEQAFVREYADLDVSVVNGDVGPADMFPRVRSIAAGVSALSAGEDDYVWILDDDDYPLPHAARFWELMLGQGAVVVADSLVFKERWTGEGREQALRESVMDSRFSASRYFEILNGYNFVPVCSVFFPVQVLRDVVARYALRGNYYEDYMLLTAAMLAAPSRYVPLAVAGISMHHDNTVLERDKIRWNHSYATFMGELARHGPLPGCCYEYLTAVNIWFQERRVAKEVLARLPFSGQLAGLARKILDWFARLR
jgi:hypothetical protein